MKQLTLSINGAPTGASGGMERSEMERIGSVCYVDDGHGVKIMASRKMRTILKYMARCELHSPLLSPMQIAILLLLREEAVAMSYFEIAIELRISQGDVKSNLSSIADNYGQDVINQKDGKTSLTGKGKELLPEYY